MNWYRFDENGNLITGFFSDQDGKLYYLDKDGIMVTGWQLIDSKWYFFNPVSDGTKGSLYQNTTTPDGYRVGPDGVWES